jgi:hypothetical protein
MKDTIDRNATKGIMMKGTTMMKGIIMALYDVIDVGDEVVITPKISSGYLVKRNACRFCSVVSRDKKGIVVRFQDRNTLLVNRDEITKDL